MTQFDDIVVTPVYGPLNTNQYPPVSGPHFIGVLTGTRPTPQQFYPSQEPPNASQTTNARHHYLRATGENNYFLARQKLLSLQSTGTSYDYSTGIQHHVSAHMNYITPISSSQQIEILKANAIGKSSYKVGLPAAAPYTTKNYYPSGVRSSLRRNRSGGCVAPKKKGSIYNTSLSNCCYIYPPPLPVIKILFGDYVKTSNSFYNNIITFNGNGSIYVQNAPITLKYILVGSGGSGTIILYY